MKKINFNPAVPTTTVIIAKKGQPNMVVVFESNGKHGNKRVLPGGRVKVGHHSWLETGIIEAKEEVSITDLKDIKFFSIGSKPGRDTRIVPLKKYLDGADVPTGIDEDKIQVEAHYGFDLVMMATSEMEPIPDNVETKNAFYTDVFNMCSADYAVDHGDILIAYANYLNTGKLPGLDQF